MSAERQTIRILLVEDNPSDVFLLKLALRRSTDVQFDITSVSRVCEAVESLADHSVDVVVTDLNLPDSVGAETIRGLVHHTHGLPIIALTGWDDAALGGRLIDEGACAYWSKDRLRDPEFPKAIARLVLQC